MRSPPWSQNKTFGLNSKVGERRHPIALEGRKRNERPKSGVKMAFQPVNSSSKEICLQ